MNEREKVDEVVEERVNLEKAVEELINIESRENESNTPDFILAEFMVRCLDAFEIASNRREVWYGVELDILNDWLELIMQAIGEASMCWSNIDGAGTFDATKAKEVGERLLRDIKGKERKCPK